MADDLLFIDDEPESGAEVGKPDNEEAWIIMIVDDEPGVHEITKLVMRDFQFDGRGLKFVHCYSGSEALTVLKQRDDIALILLDVDRFKEYNDIYGHTAGDECLQKICRTIANVAARRPGDLAARYGGEELAVLLPGTDVEAAALLAERIRAAVRALEIEHVGAIDGFVTLSAGVDALRPEAGAVQPKELVRGADKALYVAKSGGRNRVCTNETPVT